MDVTDEEALEIALIENLQRKDLTPFEEAEGYRMLAESHGYTHEEISEAVGKSRTVVTESLSLLQMPPRVRDTVQALGITSKSLLLEVLKAGSEDEMIDLLEEVARRGLNRDDLRQRLRRGDKGGKSGRRKPVRLPVQGAGPDLQPVAELPAERGRPGGPDPRPRADPGRSAAEPLLEKKTRDEHGQSRTPGSESVFVLASPCSSVFRPCFPRHTNSR